MKRLVLTLDVPDTPAVREALAYLRDTTCPEESWDAKQPNARGGLESTPRSAAWEAIGEAIARALPR